MLIDFSALTTEQALNFLRKRSVKIVARPAKGGTENFMIRVPAEVMSR